MKLTRMKFAIIAAVGFSLAASSITIAQTPGARIFTPTPAAASAPTAVPPLIPYSGVAIGFDNKPLMGVTSMTFMIFNDELDGEPLFSEHQEVILDAGGNYKVQLGASLPSGIPIDLFSTGESRWLEVQIAGERPQPRVLLVSVPYALKAADAATLGGLPASAFALAGSSQAGTNRTLNAATNFAAASPAVAAASSVTTPGGTAGSFAVFSGASSIANSTLFQNSTGIGVGTSTPAATLDVNGASLFRGNLSLPPFGSATATAGVNSFPLTFSAQGYNSSTMATITPTFQWQAIPTGNNTAAPSAALNLLSSNGSAAATATGLYINPNGTVHFATGQTFPNTASGTITGVTAGTDLIGGGAAGNVTLNLDTTKVVTGVTAGPGLTGGGTGGKLTLNLDTTKIPQLGAASNSFTGNLSVGGAISTPGTIAAGQINGNNAAFSGTITSRGLLFPATADATRDVGSGSYPIDMQASSWDLQLGPSTKKFRWQAEPVNNYSGFTSASMNLLYGSGGSTPAETGVVFGADGSLNTTALATGTINSSSLWTGRAVVSQPRGTVATPALIIQADDDGLSRKAAQQLVIQGSSITGQELLVGYVTTPNTNSDGGRATIQATWTGVTNTGLYLQPNGGCVCIRTSSPGYAGQPLVVGQGQGLAVADGWATYSSRRFKSNVQTLPDALSKVEKLRGVSYTLNATGKREIGLIAEEVGAVVPEVVTWEANGKDAQSVDYTRLTALLIEATKQQQAEIAILNANLATALQQIKVQQTAMRRQTASVKTLALQIQTTRKKLQAVDRSTISSQGVSAVMGKTIAIATPAESLGKGGIGLSLR